VTYVEWAKLAGMVTLAVVAGYFVLLVVLRGLLKLYQLLLHLMEIAADKIADLPVLAFSSVIRLLGLRKATYSKADYAEALKVLGLPATFDPADIEKRVTTLMTILGKDASSIWFQERVTLARAVVEQGFQK
jgi:hypothetical protein